MMFDEAVIWSSWTFERAENKKRTELTVKEKQKKQKKRERERKTGLKVLTVRE